MAAIFAQTEREQAMETTQLSVVEALRQAHIALLKDLKELEEAVILRWHRVS